MDKSDLEREFERDFELVRDNYRALCPFHDERKPSFLVHHTDLIGNCFGCGAGGNIDELLSRYRSIGVEESRRRLQILVSDSLTRAKAKKREKRVTKYYPESWLAPWKEEVHKYVCSRGFDASSIKDAGSCYDRSAKRQVFPHRDRGGRLLGATGRACVGQDPKWYHYWGYDKGQALYRPFEVSSLRPVLVVEGVFDLLWLYQNGVDNVVATLGSKATQAQIRELRQTSSDIILGFDNDVAGMEGTESTYRRLRRTTKVRFIRWPDESHDWMDLQGEELEHVLSTGPRSRVQQSLSGRTGQGTPHTRRQEEQVRTA